MNKYVNQIGGDSPGLSGFWDFLGGAQNVIDQGVQRVDETNANIKTTNETVNKLYSDYKTIQPYVIGFCVILTGYLATGLIVNFNTIRKNGK